jgi:quinol-cytochrome oxidoreductase complex cytochrome b subunit
MLDYLPGAGGWLRDLLRGGEEVGPTTLVNFYTLHTTVLPVLLGGLMALHFWRVRKAGGVVTPRSPDGTPTAASDATTGNDAGAKVTFIPHLLEREVAQALVLIAVVLVLAALTGAPLGEPANPGMSPNPAKAPWYFQGFQELQIHLHPFFAVLVLPALALVGFLLLPYWHHQEEEAGVWFRSRRGRRLAVGAALVALLVTPLAVILDERIRGQVGGAASWPAAIGRGVLPLAVVLVVLAGMAWLLRRRLGATRGELLQAGVVLVLVAFAVLTATSVWFRGTGMALVWPGGG